MKPPRPSLTCFHQLALLPKNLREGDGACRAGGRRRGLHGSLRVLRVSHGQSPAAARGPQWSSVLPLRGRREAPAAAGLQREPGQGHGEHRGGGAPGAALVPAPSPNLAAGGRRRLPAALSLPPEQLKGRGEDGGGRSRAAMPPPPPPRCGGPASGLPPLLRGRSSALTRSPLPRPLGPGGAVPSQTPSPVGVWGGRWLVGVLFSSGMQGRE